MIDRITEQPFCQTRVSGSTFINADCFDVFPHIEKAIDSDGWYQTEKNDQWLPLQSYHLSFLQFRNGNKDFIPKALLKQ